MILIKKTSLLIVLVIIITGLTSCIPSDILVENKDTTVSDEQIVLSNLSGTEDTSVWDKKGDIYVYPGSGYLYKTDINLSSYKSVFNESVWVIDIIDGRIYYSYDDGKNAGYIFSCTLNGTNKQKIIEDEDNNIWNIFVSENKFYYTKISVPDSHQDDGFYVLDMNTKKKRKINEDSPMGFVEKNGLLYYYCTLNTNETILKSYDMKTGEIKDALSWNNIIGFFPGNVIDGYIYYQNHTNNKMYRIKSDGTNKEVLFDCEEFMTVKVYDGKGYYKGKSIGAIDLNTGKKKVLYDNFDKIDGYNAEDSTIFNIMNDTIFFDKYLNGSQKFCRMDLDGSNYAEIDYY